MQLVFAKYILLTKTLVKRTVGFFFVSPHLSALPSRGCVQGQELNRNGALSPRGSRKRMSWREQVAISRLTSAVAKLKTGRITLLQCGSFQGGEKGHTAGHPRKDPETLAWIHPKTQIRTLAPTKLYSHNHYWVRGSWTGLVKEIVELLSKEINSIRPIRYSKNWDFTAKVSRKGPMEAASPWHFSRMGGEVATAHEPKWSAIIAQFLPWLTFVSSE